ncbi:hypothetical protein GCM10009863_22450 [Streptomyces axinellae]|uniref:Uncharacterized protein n=1 Tax=Streptomyces axinellae TaxID=552788 RepID=A0ABN3PZH8_9ACTN
MPWAPVRSPPPAGSRIPRIPGTGDPGDTRRARPPPYRRGPAPPSRRPASRPGDLFRALSRRDPARPRHGPGAVDPAHDVGETLAEPPMYAGFPDSAATICGIPALTGM